MTKRLKNKKVVVGLIILFLVGFIVYAADYYRIGSGEEEAICEYGLRRLVSNRDSRDLFIPTRTEDEWSSFVENHPDSSNLQTIECCSDADCDQGYICEDYFCSPIEYRLSCSVGSGSGSVGGDCDSDINHGDSATVTANPSDGYEFSHWSGDASGTSASYTFNDVTADKSATANFEDSWSCGDNLVDDRDGQSYRTVEIGNQCWMADNLNYSNHPVGDSWCYDNSSSNCNTYGRLYEWHAVAGGLCPDGWHVPSLSEVETMESWLSSRGYDGDSIKDPAHDWCDSSSGCGDIEWYGEPGGHYNPYTPQFVNLDRYGNWWTSSEDGGSYAWRYGMSQWTSSLSVGNTSQDKNLGYSVRCIKN